MKLKRRASITRDVEIPWFVVLKTAYHKPLVEALKATKFPGAQYVSGNKTWLWPIESVEVLVQLLEEFDYEVLLDLGVSPTMPRAVPPSARTDAG